MGDVKRNINLRLPTKMKPSTKPISPQISPYTDRLVEELSSGRTSRTDLRKTQVADSSEKTERDELHIKQKKRLEEKVKQLTLLAQEKDLRIEDLELQGKKLQYQLERLMEEK